MAAPCKDGESEGVDYKHRDKLSKPYCKPDVHCRFNRYPFKQLFQYCFPFYLNRIWNKKKLIIRNYYRLSAEIKYISKGLVIQKQVKNNTGKNERRLGVILTTFSSSK